MKTADPEIREIELLTRPGCANTPVMKANLDAALDASGVAIRYEVIDIGDLSTADARRGYSTPTVLYRGRDLFGMPVPVPPFPEPA